jgi:hypothetical protein
MALTQYFVERLIAHRDVWMIKFDEEEYGPYKSQSEACSLRSTPPKAQRTRREGPGRDYRRHLAPRPGHQPRVVVSLAAPACNRLPTRGESGGVLNTCPVLTQRRPLVSCRDWRPKRDGGFAKRKYGPLSAHRTEDPASA